MRIGRSPRQMYRIVAVLFLLAGYYSVSDLKAQIAATGKVYSVQDKKAIRLYEEALLDMRARMASEAALKLEKALQRDSTFLEAHLQLLEIARIMRDKPRQMQHMLTLARLRPKNAEAPDFYFFAADYYRNEGLYTYAATLFQKGLSTGGRLTIDTKRKLERGLASCRFADSAIANPIAIIKKPLPENVNRFILQYNASTTADDQVMIFTARKGLSSAYDEDIYAVQRSPQGEWQTPGEISPRINSAGNEGMSNLSADGRTMVFCSCNRSAKANCDIYISRRTGQNWSTPMPVDSANSSAWDSHPSLSADGNTLYFVSARAGGLGKHDIYIARKQRDGLWSRAWNAGPTINTSENDMTPFLHADGESLFFTSSGHIGMGGSDLFVSHRKPATPGDKDYRAGYTEFTKPENLGYPLNTSHDEASFFLNPEGTKAYYCLEEEDRGMIVKSTIYEFDFAKSLLNTRKSYVVKGKITDAKTGKPLMAAVELIDNKTGRGVYVAESDSATGLYMMVLPEGKEYGLNVNRKSYLFQSRYFDFSQAKERGSLVMDFALTRLEVGAATVLNNVFFESNSFALLPESKLELDRVALLMRDNPSLKVELGGHTDDVGEDAANILLSQKRAAAVYTYLAQNKVAQIRMKPVGYGEKKPAQIGVDERSRALNRRIEFKIVQIGA
jgi:OmpA-OmpF porin, OOP family